jgi:hypothetical protein
MESYTMSEIIIFWQALRFVFADVEEEMQFNKKSRSPTLPKPL